MINKNIKDPKETRKKVEAIIKNRKPDRKPDRKPNGTERILNGTGAAKAKKRN